MVTRFEIKHALTDDAIVADWLEVYAGAERVILGSSRMTNLTVEAYSRTLDKLREKNSTAS